MLEDVVGTLGTLTTGFQDLRELFNMAKSEADDDTLLLVDADAKDLETKVKDLEFRRMFSNPMDPNNCFIDIQSGAGGTEAQDWAQMLMRQYLK